MRVTIADEEGEPATWPGIFHSDPALDLQLPIPPSWWEEIAKKSDFAPEDWNSLESRIPTPRNPAHPESPRDNLLERTLLGRIAETAFGERQLSYSFGYDKVGRNRAVVTIDFRSWCEQHPELCEDLKGAQEDLATSMWSFDLTFTSDGTAQYTLTTTKEGHVPVVKQGFVDFKGDSIDLDEFPEEIRLPLAPPQASAQDRSGVEVAAAIGSPRIAGNELQTFLISDEGVQPATYQPGDWLEPKDGSNQRMMIVAAGPATAASSNSARSVEYVTAAWFSSNSETFAFATHAVLRGPSTLPALSLASFARNRFYPLGHAGSQYNLAASTITQLQVVCMQQDSATYRIPTRGDRYFSQPKSAEGAVQLCQRDCALNETTNVQECVWKCEEN